MREHIRTIAACVATALAATAVTTSAAVPAHAARTMPHVEIGIPLQDVNGQADAGAVEFRDSNGTIQYLTAPEPGPGDRFGTATAAADLDGDGDEDLLVGAPGKDVAGKTDAGAVYVFLMTGRAGPAYWRTITMDQSEIDGEAQAGAAFGSSLFNERIQWDPDAGETFMVGAPGYDVAIDGGGVAVDAGAVVDLDIGSGPRVWSGFLLTEADWEGEQPEAYDRFGTALAENDSIRGIGAPGETVNGQAGAGAVFYRASLIDVGADAVMTQDSPGMPGAAETGDHFGQVLLSNFDRIYVGVPDEDVGTEVDAGMVSTILDGGWEDQPTAGPAFTQNSVDDVTGAALEGAAEAGDRFGASFSWQATGSGWTEDRTSVMSIGVPGEDLGPARDAGMVNVLHSAQVRALTDASLGGTNETGDRFGQTLLARPVEYPLAVVGIPGENGVGVVKLTTPIRVTWRSVVGPEYDGRYGWSLGSSV
ncbi:hypothetical protein [Flindersiella endophytica]